MHLSNYPRYFIKNGERRAVYYSVEARDLKALGWTEEGTKVKVTAQTSIAVNTQEKTESKVEAKEAVLPEIEAKEEPVKEVEPIVKQEEKSVFSSLTRPELLQYALDRGVDLPNNSLKAELVEACEALK